MMKKANEKKKNNIIIIGSGGHAISVANVALSAGFNIKCFVDKSKKGNNLLNFKIIGDLLELDNYSDYEFAIGVGDNSARELIFNELNLNYPNLKFPILAHPSATISFFTSVNEGTIVMPNAVLGPNTKVGKFCVINTNASIDHDCIMLDYSSLAPASVAGGGVHIGVRSAISIGAVIKHGVKIGNDSVLGANSFLNRDLPSCKIAYGNPSKIIRDRKKGEAYL